ncbi:GGDEF domain-containing protein [Shewanella sp. SR44-3]|uniref:GGDEF domain-containing protein n=1 Tax=unclassified Shewanella TaxID=196818 RepID=UPI0015FDFE58|nr:GGDEF domain-containing protein [Shewanella sp. SR44-3]MBB1270474.1 GGDEF domain-containing protein [Shewanella sp. SR44-3]
MDLFELNSSNKLKHQLLLGMSTMTSVISGSLAFLNFSFSPHLALACFQTLFTCLSVYLIWRLRRGELTRKLIMVYLTCLSVLVLYASYSASLTSTVHLWAFVLPMMYYFLLGERSAWLFCGALFISQCINIYLKTQAWFSPPVVNFAMCYVLIWYISHIYDTARNRSEAALAKLALKDALTGVNNRLALKRAFELESKPLVGSQDPSLSVILIDVDFFKKVNDMHGHETGDNVLIEIAKLLSSKVGSDKVFRIGGEEFCILLPGKNLAQASLTAEKLRHSVQEQQFVFKGNTIEVTISLGVAECTFEMLLTQVLNQADEALYRAKAQGRNCVVSAVSEQELPA